MKKIMLIFLLLGTGIHLTLATEKKNAELPEGAKLKLPALFADNMVLQQQAEDAVWGWAVPGQKIEVKGSWNHQATEYTRADEKGHWKVHLKTPQAGGPYQLTIIGKDTLVLHNVMMGEVWICSGQSNMEMPVQGWDGASILHSEKEIKEADFPNIRLFKVERKIAFQPQDDCTGSWTECRPETVADFSATAYFFGKQLYEKLKVPIGLIETCWGGTVAEAWTSRSGLKGLGDFGGALEKVDSIRHHIAKDKTSEKPEKNTQKNPNLPTVLYNGMIHPLIPYAMKGVIWYQGESNVGRAKQYGRLFPDMIQDWRRQWKKGTFPFYYVQIAPYPYGGSGRKGAALRDAQRKSLSVSNTGMVVTLDIGDTTNIHPANKEEVGRRLSLWALNKTYGRKNRIYSGPLFDKMEVKGAKAVVFFKHTDGGLISKGGQLDYFEIAGKDGKFVPAKAAIKGQKIVVQSSQVSHPREVRFGWRDNAVPHLFNKAGLPASSFSTLQKTKMQSTAWQRADQLGRGMNLSWLESYWNGTEAEHFEDYLDMNSIKEKKQDLKLMHQLGFNTVRLPVSFDHWTSQKVPYRIVKTKYFAAIDSILKWAKQYDLNVIIDNHHGALDDSDQVMQKLPRAIAIWKQVAQRYKNTDPEKVFFEIYNEPHDISNAQWKKCAIQLIKSVRAIVPKHTLIVGGAEWNSISGLQKMGKLPDDNIIYTFHFYDPFLFTHQGAEWAGVKATSNIHIPFPYDAAKMPSMNPESKGTYGESNYKKYKQQGKKSFLKKELKEAKSFSEKYNVPVFCGEWGSYKKYADQESRCRYTATVKGLLETLHIPYAYWEWNQSFSLFNGKPAEKNIPSCMKVAWGIE